jgi:hypothetical protein
MVFKLKFRIIFYRSDEALDLHIIIKKLGNMPEFCAEEYLINFFETLYFQRMGIEKMD